MNLEKTGYESVLSLEKLYFENILFYRKKDISDETKLAIDVGRKIDTLLENKYKVVIDFTLSDKENDDLRISLRAVGEFLFENSAKLDKDFELDVIDRNTLPIMFPYIRSQISLITTQPDMHPVVLPLINVNLLLEKK